MCCFRLAGLVAGVLWKIVVVSSAPTMQSMTFQFEMADRLDDFTATTTVYFSVIHQAYRFDFSDGHNVLYMYPKEGIAYYYYPTSDFRKKQFNVTSCEYLRTQLMGELVSPLPSLDLEFKYVGPDSVYDTKADKYVLSSPGKMKAMWVEKVDPLTGLEQRPIRIMVEERQKSLGTLQRHRQAEYFNFSLGEQHSSIWDRPQLQCHNATELGHATLFWSMPLDLFNPGLSDGILDFMSASWEQYHGKDWWRDWWKHQQDTELLLQFPYNQAEVDSLAKSLPQNLDWRDHGAVTNVKNQRASSTCWVFGTIGALESAYYLKTGRLVSFSEQAIVDCAGSVPLETNNSLYANGCFGGYIPQIFSWINHTGGIVPTAEYSPYQQTNGYCRVTEHTKLTGNLIGYYHIPKNFNALKVALVSFGPLVVSIDPSRLTKIDKGIAERESDCNPHEWIRVHTLLLVGYGITDDETPYWIFKDSSGSNSDINGYILAKYYPDDYLCLLQRAFFPVLV